MKTETSTAVFRVLQTVIRLAWGVWFLHQLWDMVGLERWHDVLWLSIGLLVMAALGLVIWIGQKRPVVVKVGLIAVTVVGLVVFLEQIGSAIGWGVVSGEGQYVTLLVLYLPLMGLGWLAWTKLKPRKP